MSCNCDECNGTKNRNDDYDDRGRNVDKGCKEHTKARGHKDSDRDNGCKGGRNGRDGRDGRAGRDGKCGKDGCAGPRGPPGTALGAASFFSTAEVAIEVLAGNPVPFASNGAAFGNIITRVSATEFTVNSTGIYDVEFVVPAAIGTLAVEVNGGVLANTRTSSLAGGPIVGSYMLSLNTGDRVRIVNVGALSITIAGVEGLGTNAWLKFVELTGTNV